MIKRVIHITDSLPNYNGGVSDYSYLISKGLKEKFQIETYFITVKPFNDYDKSIFTNITNISKKKNLFESVTNIIKNNFDKSEKVIILLEYVPHAYQKRGCPIWLLSELKKIKRNIPNVDLITMFHELYATSNDFKTSTFWLTTIQKSITKSIFKLSDFTFTNTLKYKKELQCYLDKEIEVLPVFSNIGETENITKKQINKNSAIIFGSIEKRQMVYDNPKILLDWCNRLKIKKIYDIGSNKPNVYSLPIKIEYKGRLASKEIMNIIKEVNYGIVNNGDGGSLEKSGIYASYIANGICPIVIKCDQGESIFTKDIDYIYTYDTENINFQLIIDSSFTKYKKNSSLELHVNKYFKRLKF